MSQPAPVFISYATADRAQALAICADLEARGTPCWISTRDVAPGQNYQEAIVRALRASPAMVLVFSEAANGSDEIKKELSLASRFHVPVMAMRIADVEPSDAFAYELSTRQWVDAFDDREAAIDLIVEGLGPAGSASTSSGRSAAVHPAPAPEVPDARRRSKGLLIAAAATIAVLIAALAAWQWLRPAPDPRHSMAVRLAGFQSLSPDLPPAVRDAIGAEIAAAFNSDGVVSVSTAAAPEKGDEQGYALGGTIRREGDVVRVISQLTNERTGVALWSTTFDYPGADLAAVPRHVAVDVGNVVRCGLFGASTYAGPLPDTVLRDYLQFCEAHWATDMVDGRKGLVAARRVVDSAPDFSWGWAGVAGGYWKVAMTAADPQAARAASASGRDAAERAIALDARNSEALWLKAVMLDPHDWSGREALFKRAIAARTLDCGCEHHQYGVMLANVGRLGEALEQLHQADDMLSLYIYTAMSLADTLAAAGKPNEAKRYYEDAGRLAPDESFARGIAVNAAIATGDIGPLLAPDAPRPPEQRAALVAAYRAAESGDAPARAAAVKALTTLPARQQNKDVALLLGRLGANHEALLLAAKLAEANTYSGPAIFWYPSMRGVLREPGFPAVAEKLGLVRYWKAAQVKPDVCGGKAAPPFCQAL